MEGWRTDRRTDGQPLLSPQTDRKDPQGASVAGFDFLLQKQLKGKQMQKEMADFFHER